jgi:hypothetical protein
MHKFGLAFVSLVAAVPAGILCYLLANVMFTQWETMRPAVQVLLGTGLGLGGLVALIPVGVLIFTPTAGKVKADETAAEMPAPEAEVGGVKERIEAAKEKQAADKARKAKQDEDEVDMDDLDDDLGEDLDDDEWADKR